VSKGARLGLAIGVLVIGAALIAVFFWKATDQPATLDFTAGGSGQPVNVTLQTVGSLGSGNDPTWVSYLIRSPQGQWEHTTVFQVPAHTQVNMTIINYDSGSPLRNQQLGQVTGTLGSFATLDGRPFRVINSNATNGNGVAHTFSIPTLGISVPLYGNNANANLCGAAPCTTSSPHRIIRFSFMSPGAGSYPWQCFVPCGLGWLFGNAGPMQTVGYMGGFLQVVD